VIVSILGCGWYGKALAKSLTEKGTTVKGSATSPGKLEQLNLSGIDPYLVQFKADKTSYNPAFFNCDVLIISIPPKARQGEAAEYLPKIKNIISAILQHEIRKVIYVSSTAVYSDSNKEVSELDPPEPDTETGKILFDAEKLFESQTLFKTTIIRFAGLVGPGRHPGRFFAGKKNLPNGQAPVNLIHLDDCTGITIAVIEKDAFGVVLNAGSPHHPPKAEFYTNATAKAGLEIPEFINELKSWKLISSNLLTDVLNYEFKFGKWNDCAFND